MPEILQIQNIGMVGLNTDLPPASLPPEAITSGNNFRAGGGVTVRFGGEAWLANCPITPKFLYPVDTNTDVWLMFDETSCYSWNGTAFVDVTNGQISAPNAYKWTGCHLGRIAIFANAGQSPVYWDGALLQPLNWDESNTWAAKNYKAASIRSFGQYLLAFDIYDGANHYPDMWHNSHPADLGSLPRDWDSTRLDSLSNRASFGGEGGDNLDAYALRNAVAVYRANGISFLDYRPGTDSIKFSARHVTDVVRVPNVRSICEVKGSHFLMTHDDLLVHDGNSVTSIAHDTIRKQYARAFNLDHADSAFALLNTNTKEVWFCIGRSALECDKAFVYSYRDQTWSIRDLPNIQHAGLGPINSESRTFGTWNETFGTATGTFDQGRTLPTDKTVIGANGIRVLNLDTEVTDENVLMQIERSNIPLAGLGEVTTLVRAYPRIEGGPVTIRLGSHDFINGAVRWQPPIDFNPGLQRSIDIRTTGSLHAYRIESNGTQRVRVAGLDLEFERAGRR